MKERPILFKDEMVRAILAGQKTQTRRVVKSLALDWLNQEGFTPEFVACPENSMCPYGQPGDQLWVRESHWWFKDEHDPVTGYFPPKLTAEDVEYRADGEKPVRIWRPSIHMPRWASRITLEITGVRVERVQDISNADALAEGVDGHDFSMSHAAGCGPSALGAFRELWESINGPGSWQANPWVWVVEFKRVQP